MNCPKCGAKLVLFDAHKPKQYRCSKRRCTWLPGESVSWLTTKDISGPDDADLAFAVETTARPANECVCPSCESQPLLAMFARGIAFEMCPGCGGLLIDSIDLEELCRSQRPQKEESLSAGILNIAAILGLSS